jgi:hypothetical protein
MRRGHQAQGALVLHRLANGKDEFSRNLSHWLRRELHGFLTRDADKALFAELCNSRRKHQTQKLGD